jgi:hypothetical protein
MENRISTNIEQSKHLFELGLNSDSADMFWMDTNSVKPCLNLMDDGIFNHRNYLVRFPNTSLPAWSLSALLDVMPKELLPELEWREDNNEWEVNVWINHNIHSISHYDKLCAAYEMVHWLLENGYIKTKEK